MYPEGKSPYVNSKSFNLAFFIEIFSFKKDLFLCIYKCLPACMYMYYMHIKYPRRPEEGIGFLRIGFVSFHVGAGSQIHFFCRNSKLLTAEPYLQACYRKFQMPTEVEN